MNNYFSILIVLSSWGLGGVLALLFLKETGGKFIFKTLIKENKWYKFLGVNIFRQLVTKTIYGKLNQTIKIKNGSHKTLNLARNEMIKSEIGHFIGFISSQTIFIMIYLFNYNEMFFLLGTLTNVLLNAYPFLLQQKNRIRISKIIERS